MIIRVNKDTLPLRQSSSETDCVSELSSARGNYIDDLRHSVPRVRRGVSKYAHLLAKRRNECHTLNSLFLINA